MAKRTRSGKQGQSNRDKGSLVEDVAAAMYRLPGFDVRTRIRLVPLGGVAKDSERPEIDVLITLAAPGLPVPVTFAIECKNEKAPIGPEFINAFAGKLDDVGIPRHFGLFVSTSRYSSGALRRAKKERIQTLLLVSDPADQLPEAIRQLVQPVVFVLLGVVQIYLEAGIGIPVERPEHADVLRLADGRYAGSVRDLVWAEWIRGNPSLVVGDQRMEALPTYGRGHRVDGVFARIAALSADVHLRGLMIEIPGAPERYRLIDAETKNLARERVQVKFEMKPATYSVSAADTEADLEALLRERNPMNLPVVRVRVPRIEYDAVFWPPSTSVVWKLVMIGRAHRAGRITDPRTLLREVERPDLSAAFEPVWPEYPALDLMPTAQTTEEPKKAWAGGPEPARG